MSSVCSDHLHIHYGEMSDEEVKRLWGQVGNNLTPSRLASLNYGAPPEGSAEHAYAMVRHEMVSRNLLSFKAL